MRLGVAIVPLLGLAILGHAVSQHAPEIKQQLQQLAATAQEAATEDGSSGRSTPTRPDSQATAAVEFLRTQMTISANLLGEAEPGLASLAVQNGNICRLRCGFHLAVPGFSSGGVDDAEIEFQLQDINVDSIRWDKDGLGRAMISFGSSDGAARFWRRDRDMNMKQQVLSDWTAWEKVSEAFCRTRPEETTLDRSMKALAYLAQSCGAQDSPF